MCSATAKMKFALSIIQLSCVHGPLCIVNFMENQETLHFYCCNPNKLSDQ